MFLHSILLCGLHALALAGLLTKTLTDSNAKLEQGTCPLFWHDSGTYCYRYVASRLSWVDAELYCRSLDANLVSVHDSGDMLFIGRVIENFDPAKGYHWLGFSDVHREGTWMWSDGSLTDYELWFSGQPNNTAGVEHCAHVTFWEGMEFGWNDAPCTMLASSVCKARKACPYYGL